MDPGEPHWRMNLNFSPPSSRRWDSGFLSDGLSHGTHGAPAFGSLLSSHSKGSKSGVNRDQYPNHQHSISDWVLSYYGSPSDNFQAPHWMPSEQRYDLNEFSTRAIGARPEASVFSRHNERQFPSRISSMPSSLGSVSSPSESSRWASPSKQPIFFSPRNFSGRHSFMSKPVHLLVFRNPVSGGDPGVSSRTASGDSSRTSAMWPEKNYSADLEFQETLTELEKLEASPEPGASSRREGFRWSNASSYDFGFEGDAVDITEHVSPESLRSPNNSARYHKCGLCERLLLQKSPCSSYRIMRNGDKPVAGVLPCRHVFYAACLEKTTPKTLVHEPPCPLCLKSVGIDGSGSFSEPLRVALKAVRRNRVSMASNGAGSSSSLNLDHDEGDLIQNHSHMAGRHGCFLIKDHWRKRFSFRGKIRKDLFGAQVFRRIGSSSSLLLRDNRSRSGQ